MTTLAVRAAPALAAPEGHDVFLEYESTNGIPDVVFASFDEEAIAERERGALSATFVDASDVAVLLALDETRTHHDLVAERARLSASTTLARLRALRRAGAVDREPKVGWRRLATFPDRLRGATALELKLRDWRRAIDQAARYRAFAERTLVIVDADRAASARAQAATFRFNGIGLAVLSAWGEIEQLVRAPDAVALDPVARIVAGERLWLNLQRSAPGRVAA